ncbi:MAG: penicillin-binding protein 2 [Candidatus Aureabacteria bacterium]|nr:penicillin-binding protein 2 [Candidatus Auribacterota bacterium]
MKKRNFMSFRTFLVMMGIIVLWGGLIYRLLFLQIQSAPVLVKKAEKQQEAVLKVYPQRGKILDRNGNIFAVSMKVKSAFCVPSEVDELWRTAGKLARILDMPKSRLIHKLTRKSHFSWIKRKLTDEETSRIENEGMRGIYLVDEVKRFYPKASLLSHVVGFVNIDNEGLAGLEKSLDHFLRGKTGSATIIHDAKGRELYAKRDFIEKPEDGLDVYLTVDEVIQHIVEEELDKVYETYQAKGAVAIVVDVTNGDILAMANCPTFDLNLPGEFSADKRRNRALVDCYEPGSLFKIVIGAAALNENLISMNDLIDCEKGAYRIGGHTLHDSHPYDVLPFVSVIAKSSNIGCAKVASMMSRETFYHYIRQFGFGQTIGLPLEGELRGKVRNYQRWSGYSQTAMAMGQEIMVTPLQMVFAFATIANKGKKPVGRLIDRIVGPQNQLIRKNEIREGKSIVSPRTAMKLTQALKLVVSKSGTAYEARVEGYSVAGKTGTAQKVENGTYSHSKFLASFIGFVPADHPVLAIGVMVDEPKGKVYYGGQVAAPGFSVMAERILSYLKIPPEENADENLKQLEKRYAA